VPCGTGPTELGEGGCMDVRQSGIWSVILIQGEIDYPNHTCEVKNKKDEGVGLLGLPCVPSLP
jgi:hypothetical protein